MFNTAASLTSPYNQGTKQTLPSTRSQTTIPAWGATIPLSP